MAFSCLCLKGCASGSLLAAAVMALSSSAVGIRIMERLENFDIVFYLAPIGKAQTDDASHLTTVYKRHVVVISRWRRVLHGLLVPCAQRRPEAPEPYATTLALAAAAAAAAAAQCRQMRLANKSRPLQYR